MSWKVSKAMTDQRTQTRFMTMTIEPDSLYDVAAHTKEMLLAGNYADCLNFLQSQPKALVNSSVSLLVYQAAAMLFSEFSQESIEVVLTRAEQIPDVKNWTGEITAIRAIICSYTDDPEKAICLSHNALRKIDSENTFFTNIIHRNLGVAYTLKNDLRNADIWFEKLLMSSYQLEDWGGVLAAYHYLTFIRKVQGRLREAEIIYKKALNFIQKHDLARMPHGIKIIAGYGHLLLYWHRVKEAKSCFRNAIHSASQSDILYGYTAYQNLCEAYIRENDTDKAKNILSELHCHIQGKEELYEKIHLQHTQSLEARISLEEGRIDDGLEWLRVSGFLDLTPDEMFQRYGYTLGIILPIAARIFILRGMNDRAIQTLKAIIPKFIHQGANSYLIRSFCALAIAYDQKGQSHKAVVSLKKALELGEPENNLGDFIFLGQSLIPVLKHYQHNAPEQDFSSKLLSILEKYPLLRQQKVKRNLANTGLTPREIDVLILIANGMTNQQIARSLYLSKNTIKSHNNNIYRKLNVENRDQAVKKARKLGILAQTSRPGSNIIPCY